MQIHLINQVLFNYDGGVGGNKGDDDDDGDDASNETQPTVFLNHSRCEPERKIVGFPSTHNISYMFHFSWFCEKIP